MWTFYELLNVKCIVFKHNHGSFVVVEITVIWGRKYRDYSRKLIRPGPFMHFESVILCLMCPYDRNDFILFKKLFGQLKAEEIGTSSDLIGFCNFLASAILIVDRIGPHEITKQARLGHFLDPINILNVVQLKLSKKLTDSSSGEIPPCTQRNFPLIKQARGRQSNMHMILS